MSLQPLVFADTLGEELAYFGSLLDADITIQDRALAESPQDILVSITAINPYSEPMPLYVIRNRGYGWEVVKLVGALAPASSSTIELEVEVRYEKLSEKSTRYAVVARGEDGTLYGRYFDIVEDWHPYENGIQESLTFAMNTVLPVAVVLLVVLLAVVARVAYFSKSPGVDAGEYTMKSMVFPEVQGRPFEEKIADLLIHPLILVVELLCVGAIALVMHETLSQSGSQQDAVQLIILAGVASFIVPFLYFAAAWYFEKREERKPLRFFGGIFVWGMFAAFCSLLISSYLVGQLQLQ